MTKDSMSELHIAERLIEQREFKFDENDKKEYLIDILNNSTIGSFKTHLFALDLVDRFEKSFDKPLILFTANDLDKMIRSIETRLRRTVEYKISLIRKYYKYILNAQNIDRTLIGIKYLSMMRGDVKPMKTYITDTGSIYYPKLEEMNKLFDKINDPGSTCILIAVYSGIRGTAGKDILNIKLSDMYSDGTIYVESLNKRVKLEIELIDDFVRNLSILQERYRDEGLNNVYLFKTVNIYGTKIHTNAPPSQHHISLFFRTISYALGVQINLKSMYAAGVYELMMVTFGKFVPILDYEDFIKENNLDCSYKYMQRVVRSIRHNSRRLKDLK